MRKSRIGWAILCAALLLSCGPKGEPLPAEQRLALEENYADLDVENPQELRELLDNYETTQNADYHTDSGWSLLHLACLKKDTALVQKLLAAGADPNRRTREEGYTPLQLAIMIADPEEGAEATDSTVKELIDMLLAAGADIREKTGADPAVTLLMHQVLAGSGEDIFLYLLDKGAETRDALTYAASAHYARAVERLLKTEKPGPGVLAAACCGRGEGDREETVRLLLEAGADPNDESGELPLNAAAAQLLEAEPSPETAAVIELLLEKGALADRPCRELPDGAGLTAADMIASQAELLAELQEKGYQVKPEPLIIRPGETLATDITRAFIREAEDKGAQLRPYADVLAKALREGVLPELTLHLLVQADAAKAAETVCALPMWQQLGAETPASAEMLNALGAVKTLVLPKDFVLTQARALAAIGQGEAASAVAELLERCPDADADIEALLHDDSPDLQVGAWTAKLHRAGLPDAKAGDVEAWLEERGLNPACMSAAVVEALHLTSLHELWMGEMEPTQQEALFQAISHLGQQKAAERYRAIAAALDDPDRLDSLTADKETWAPALEAATARFIWENRAAFLGDEDTD